MELNKTIKQIKTLKIQGAANVALAAIKTLNHVAQKSKAKNKKDFLKQLKNVQHKLATSRATEPEMRNSLNYILTKLKPKTIPELKQEIRTRSNYALNHIKTSKDYIAHIGSHKVKNHMAIFTHCHSSTVINLLKFAKNKHRKFYVNNTETRPLYQGRKTAKDLAELKIPVKHFVDSAAAVALEHSDIMFIGADAITAKGEVINKIGSRLMAETAEFYNTRIYVCTDSWAYDPRTKHHKEKIEHRDPAEIWDRPPKGIKIINPAFEIVPPHLITGIISELGTYKPDIFIHKVKREYPWLR